MKTFEINLLGISENKDYIHYEIINHHQSIKGWYKLPYGLLKYMFSYNDFKGHQCTMKNNEYKAFKRKYPNNIGLELQQYSYTTFITVEGCELIKQKIREMYN